MSFSNIFANGVLVDIDVHMWTGQKQLTPEDLGINSNNLSKAFKLGKKALVPPEVIGQFRHIDYKARQLLITNSFPFEFGNARFVPKKKFVEFSEKIEELQKEFNKLADEFIDKYPHYKIEMRKYYTQAAHSAYDRLSQIKGFDKTRDEFVNQFIARVDTFYPSQDKLREKFSLDYVAFQMALPDLSQATIDDIAEEGTKVKMIEQAYQKVLTDRVRGYVNKILDELRTKANDVLSLVAENIKNGKRFSEATISMLKNMISDYRKMDIIGDTSFQAKLDSFERDYLIPNDAKKVREDQALRQKIYEQVKILLEHANDKAVIESLAQNYRQKINL